MKLTNEDIDKISNEIKEFISKKINSALSPLSLLTYAVKQVGCPVLTYQDMYDPNNGNTNTDNQNDVCYGVYIDPSTKTYTKLVAMGHNLDSHELFSLDAVEFLDIFSATREDYNKMATDFAEHFLKPTGLSIKELGESVRKSVILGIAKSVSYADIIHAYTMEEVGRFHNDYDGQLYVEDCRESANKADETDDDRDPFDRIINFQVG